MQKQSYRNPGTITVKFFYIHVYFLLFCFSDEKTVLKYIIVILTYLK